MPAATVQLAAPDTPAPAGSLVCRGLCTGFFPFSGGFQLLAVLGIFQLLCALFCRAFHQTFPFMGSLYAGILILVLLVHLFVGSPGSNRVQSRFAAAVFGAFFDDFSLAEPELR